MTLGGRGLTIAGCSLALALLVPLSAAGSRQAVTFGHDSGAWRTYYDNPGVQGTWGPFCAGGGGSVQFTVASVPACGPVGSTGVELPQPSLKSAYAGPTPGFNCVELSERFLYVYSHWRPIQVNACKDLLAAYHAAHPEVGIIQNGAANPQRRTVISFRKSTDAADPGYAGVVSSVSLDDNGNGSITVVGEGGAGNTARSDKLNVSHGRVANLGIYDSIQWLDLRRAAQPPDRDGDGVANDEDGCPYVVGPVGAGGCPLALVRTGRSAATGDFNHDGYADLAIGVPGEEVAGHPTAGAVTVLYGSATGLDAAHPVTLTEGGGLAGTRDEANYAGAALASGDFDKDGYTDLAVGVPGENVSGNDFAGAVSLIFGGPAGLNTGRTALLTEATGTPGNPSKWDWFGAALTSGDFDKDGYADLAAGIPGENVGKYQDAGAVKLFFGGPAGPTSARTLFLTEPGGLNWQATQSAYLGASLASGDFNKDGYADLAVGAASEYVLGHPESGAVDLIYGKAGGLGGHTQRLIQDNLAGDAEEHDYMGATLAAGDFDKDGYSDLAIASPGEEKSSGLVGQVDTVYGASSGLNTGKAARMEVTRSGPAALGAALAVGDFDKDGYADLAIGAPGQAVGSAGAAGSMTVIFGASSLTNRRSQTLTESGGLNDVSRSGDLLGATLAAGDFDKDGYSDLALGAPGKDVGQAQDGGAMFVTRGGVGKLVGPPKLLTRGILGETAQPGDYFAGSLFNGAGLPG